MRARREHPDTFHGTPRSQAPPQPSHARTVSPAVSSNEDLYRILYEDSPAMYFTLDCRGTILSVNRFGADHLGYTAGELAGQSVLTIFHDEDRLAVQCQLSLLLQQPGQARQWQLRKIRKDGTVMWVEEDARAVRREDGSLMILVVCSDITARKQLGNALQLTQFAVDHSSEGMFVVSADGRILSANDTICRRLEYSREELLAMTISDIDPLFPRERWPSHWQELKTAGRLVIETINRAKSGRTFPVEVSIAYFPWADKECCCSIITDISKRKQAEAALRDSEERYRLLVNQATDIIYRTDPSGHFTFVNPTSTRLMGYAEAELLGRHFTGFIRPDYRWKAMRFYRRQLLRKTPTTYFEFPALAKDGREIWFGQNVQLMQQEGRVTGLFSVTRDITERKRAEQALAASEKRLKTILETEPECVKVVTDDSVLLDMNPAGLKMVEADGLGDVRGRSVLPMIAPDHRDAFAEFIRRVYRGESGTMQFEIVGLKGTRRWVETHAVPLRDESNATIGVLAITRDITERKRAEEALHAARQEREQLARNLHDNIIQSIYAIGFTLEECQDLLKGASAHANRKLDQVIAELNRIIREVRRYLTMPAKESETLSAGELIAALQRQGELMEHANGMRFTFAIDRFAADRLNAGQRAQFLYVAQEAMSNSLRHSGASTAHVSLACTAHGVRLEIHDNGVGFALPAMRNGTGGLRNIRLRARKIGANLDIMSRPMEGTVISMEMPTNEHDDRPRKI